MEFFKVLRGDTLVGVEKSPDPIFVRWQEKNNIIIRCPKNEAEAIISGKDGETVYLLPGKELHGVETDLIAVLITEAEYEEAQGEMSEQDEPAEQDDDSTPVDGIVADDNIPANMYFSVGRNLYLSTAAIVRGSAILPGINCMETDVATALNMLNA